ncbi:unnamed protein product [Discula destructiva]
MAYLDPPAPPTRVGDPIAFSRTTRDGRRLHYELKVLQQPERARACGSGPKSSADRRPVDPPPVVQMKVFQGPHRENAEDITFGYNADFFLYASLHHDTDPHTRPTAQNGPPVLTGLPVSSMILLDRPEEAGYFIFSDLSVRHEGQYYLTFALMEEVKDDRDKDDDEAMSGTDEITGGELGSGRHFQFRTQVKTDVFDVYSAKKFPGLQESTALSRTVAEQGCRVRIRRDVRMRRREKGGKKDIASREDEYAQRAKADAAAAAAHRGRSSSNDANGQYRPVELQRHTPGMPHGYQHRPSFPTPESAPGSRQPSYGHMAPYPSAVRSIPTPPSYPSPPHATPYAQRPPYATYATAERSPPQQHGPPAQPHPRDIRDSRDSYSYRSPDPIRGPPMLAPKQPVLEQKRDTLLPPIRSIAGAVPAQRRFLHPMPRRLPQPPPPAQSGTEHITLPPMAPMAPMGPMAPMAPRSYMMDDSTRPLTPNTPSSSRKRSAGEAHLAPVDDYRLQNGRRQEQQPRDANYNMEPRRHPYVDAEGPVLLQEPEIVVHQERQQPPADWKMSLSLYNRASDSDIPVDFPGLHTSRSGSLA